MKTIAQRIAELKEAAKGGDNEVVHGLYDDLMEYLAEQYDPEAVADARKAVEDVRFWYA